MSKAKTMEMPKNDFFDEFRHGKRNVYVIAKVSVEPADLPKGSLMCIKTDKGTSLPLWRQEKEALSFMVRNKDWLTGHKVCEITNANLENYFNHYEPDKRHTLINLL